MKLGVNDYNDPTEGGVIIVRMQYCQYGLLTQCWCYFHFTAGWLGCICDTKAETLTDRTELVHLRGFDGSKNWRVVIRISNLDTYVDFFLCMCAISELSNT